MDFPTPTLPDDYNPAPEGAYGLDDGHPLPAPEREEIERDDDR